MDSINFILDYWFDHSSKWFIKDDRFDKELKKLFLDDYEQAKKGELNLWKETPKGCLALIILLDQISRNIFRGTKEAFETDETAQELTMYALDMGFVRELKIVQKIFVLMPLMHSENINVQNTSVMYFKKLMDESTSTGKNSQHLKKSYESAIEHKKIIEEYGRFPHRNKILSRRSTKKELEFLKTHEDFQ